MLFPWGVEGAKFNRVPVVSIGIAVINVAVFVVSPGHHTYDKGRTLELVGAVAGYQRAHPWLKLPRDCEFTTNMDMEELEDTSGAYEVEGGAREQQQQLNALCADLIRTVGDPYSARWGLVPARGVFQRGMVTHLFLHGDIFHLLGNLLFFYIVALLLEDLWGRLAFALFYVAAGMLAGLSQALLDLHSMIPVIGASGAIAGCMGAFTFRFASRRIKMAYWFGLIFRGTFLLPAWLFGGVWFIKEVISFKMDPSGGGVAVMAHIGGFLVGLATAFAFKVSRFETHVLTPLVTGVGPPPVVPPNLLAGQSALAAGEWIAARGSFRRVLDEHPDNPDAQWGLAYVAAQMGDSAALHKSVDRLLLRSSVETGTAVRVFREFSAVVNPLQLAPVGAAAWARAMEPQDRGRSIEIYDRGGDAPGDVGAMAILRAAELVATVRQDPPAAIGRVQRVLARVDLSDNARRRADALLAKWTPPVASTASPVYECRFAGRSADGGFVLQSRDGRTMNLLPQHLARVAAAMVAQPRPMLVVDLRLRSAGTILRTTGEQMGLETLFAPGTPPAQCFSALMQELSALGVELFPSPEALIHGRFPQHASVVEFMAKHTA